MVSGWRALCYSDNSSSFAGGKWVQRAFSQTESNLQKLIRYKISHYLGQQLYKWDASPKEELWEVSWRPGVFPEKEIRYPTAAELKQQEAAKPAMYRPPSIRSRPKPLEVAQEKSAKDEGKQLSKAAAKNKKKREAKARAREFEAEEKKNETQAEETQAKAEIGDKDKEKKLRNLRKKLKQIEQIKQQHAEGKKLEDNQLEKMKTEDDILKQIRELEVQ
eukprot:m.59811 g.59811  ORF g.59811 m.59811 type:complete len:219 (+) comp34902_c0_seq3:1834-2490(+)